MRIRLLPYAIADGPTNMAVDETLVHSAAAGIASLRFYGWTTATVSLGYFQTHTTHPANPRLSPLPWVRRPSGGATLVHHHELTYALALPAGEWQAGPSWLVRMHRIITAALADLGLAGRIALVEGRPITHGDVLCFQQWTPGDVLCAGHKVVGSAQRKHRQALMQHGSILFVQSEHTPELPGIRELTGVALTPDAVQQGIVRTFAEQTGWSVPPGDWTKAESAATLGMAIERYSSVEWNQRR